jgi:hypothetical protein
LGKDLTSKAIAHCSVVKSTEKIQDDLDVWLDDPTNVDGDTILINGDLEAKWKFVSTQYFTEKYIIQENKLKRMYIFLALWLQCLVVLELD